MDKYNAIGLMSGTSLDGLDIAACEFIYDKDKWSFTIPFCHTYPYSSEWKEKLSGLPGTTALDFSIINVEYGHLLGRLTRAFLDNSGFHPDIIASHGHTVFHQPGQGLTVQVGAGSAIAAETGIPVVCDFRTLDVALGGQGAPLVPVGDRLLFPGYDACLNLGGFANISMENNGKRVAFDICPANIILNRLASQLGLEFDADGLVARSGDLDYNLLNRLNKLQFYQELGPKSLGREWLENFFLPLIYEYSGPVNTMLRTLTEHIAIQVNSAISSYEIKNALVTGGGAHNRFLLERIRETGTCKWGVLSREITDFKEALVFAFLGILSIRGENNVLCSVTGAKADHRGGAIYHPF